MCCYLLSKKYNYRYILKKEKTKQPKFWKDSQNKHKKLSQTKSSEQKAAKFCSLKSNLIYFFYKTTTFNLVKFFFLIKPDFKYTIIISDYGWLYKI